MAITNTREQVSIDDVIVFLNELIELDKDMVVELLIKRIPCNKAIAEHPTVQVFCDVELSGQSFKNVYSVGMMGIINGLFGANRQGAGLIRYVLGDEGLIRFERNE